VKIDLAADAEELSGHIFRITVKDPQGKTNEAFSKLIFASGKNTVYEFPLPLNAVKGKWTVEVKDILSGEKACSEIKID
jgi:uncharacterized protein YfaS (alpha-2-macroglobulin family)